MAGAPYRFIARAIVALLVAFLIGRLFFHGFSTLKTLLLAAVLLALAYLFEFARRND